MSPHTTQTNGNARNGIRGSRIRIWAGESLVGAITVPHKDAGYYIGKHPGGQYAARYRELWAEAEAILQEAAY